MSENKTAVVIVSRNDGYGGSLEERAIICLNTALKAFDSVCYVDWNSDGISLLEKIKDYVKGSENIYHYKVDKDDVHHFTSDKTASKCCEPLARNIGIRRMIEEGHDYIVSSNIDIIFPSKEQIRDFVQQYMKEGLFCTVSRRDIDFKYQSNKWQENAISFLKNEERVIKNLRDNYLSYNYKNYDLYHGHACLITCCGDFQIAHKNVWERIRGFEEEFQSRGYTDTNIQLKAYNAGFPITAYFHLPLFHINHELGGAVGNNELTTEEYNSINLRIERCLLRKETRNEEDWGFIKSNFVKKII